MGKVRKLYSKTANNGEQKQDSSTFLFRAGAVITLFGLFLLCLIWIGLYYKIQSERQLEIENAFKDTANFARAFEEQTLRIIISADEAALFLKQQIETRWIGDKYC